MYQLCQAHTLLSINKGLRAVLTNMKVMHIKHYTVYVLIDVVISKLLLAIFYIYLIYIRCNETKQSTELLLS